jgi:hypothetical protein
MRLILGSFTIITFVLFIKVHSNSLKELLETVIFVTGLVWMFIEIGNRDNMHLQKDKIKGKQSLYNWSNALNGGDGLIFKLLSREKSNDVLLNLEIIKRRLLFYCKYDLHKLRLLKGYYSVKNKDIVSQIYYSTLLTFLYGLIFMIIRTVNSNTNRSHFFFDFISNYNPIQIFVSIVLVVAYSVNAMFLGKNRTRLIEEIIECCIEELQENKK